MQALARSARHLLSGILALGVLSLAAPGRAQDIDVPAGPEAHTGGGPITAPSPWTVLSVPVQQRVDLKLYGFYIGDVNVPVAQVDVPIRTTRFFTITPSYLYYSVPASGLNEMVSAPAHFTEHYDEQQFRIDGAFNFRLGGFEFVARNMYVRRFRQAPADDINRYRGRIAVAHPLVIQHRTVKPFLSYEAFYERKDGWNRDRIWTGVTVPLNKHVALQPSYLWETSKGTKDINYLLLGLLVTKK